MLWFLVALAIAAVVGSILSLPDRQAGSARWAASVSIALVTCTIAWVATDAIGMSETGPIMHLVVSVIFASAAASVFHAYLSERPPLR